MRFPKIDLPQLAAMQALGTWLNPAGVTTTVPGWVIGLLPEGQIVAAGKTLTVPQFLKYAALYGTQFADEVKLGQVSFIKKESKVWPIHFQTVPEAEKLVTFGQATCMTLPASILRTAIMLGLRLPRVGLGVMSQTRDKPLTKAELHNIVVSAMAME